MGHRSDQGQIQGGGALGAQASPPLHRKTYHYHSYGRQLGGHNCTESVLSLY